MPSKSKSQQKLFGMVHNCQKNGKCASPEIEKISKSISDKDAEDFAKTKHKGLPEKVKEKKVKKKEESISHLSSFKAYKQFRESQGCSCACKGCKDGNCKGCTCNDCKCANCGCH